eukprot:TRINITY_DN3816_c0_g1_i3.p1 TRINITY_DN3816_c0_g1~~TRINITY_DN3816_c0_g1_i3.p1  ORF type:complete len:257 (+),score=43.39 TRINITY_DN3816_c0_g1_i3:437-1207(+)
MTPCFKDADASRRKASQMLEKFSSSSNIDLLICPEMCFSGYMFTGKEDVSPHTEDVQGATFQWCVEQAKRLNCFVMAGYPQRVEKDGEVLFYNSACFVHPDGSLLMNYQKTFLYDTDKTWAEAGDGFKFIDVAELGRIGFGICMDINPKDFVAPYGLREFANFHLKNNVDLIAFSSAWLKSGDSSFSTIQYWGDRLLPLHGKPCFFMLANRVGTENGTSFTGSSCVIDLEKRALLNSLNTDQEAVLVVSIDKLKRK